MTGAMTATATLEELLAKDDGSLAELVRRQARSMPEHTAIVDGDGSMSYRDFDVAVDRIAAALQRDGVAPGDAVAVVAASSRSYAAVTFGAIRAGAAIAPLQPTLAPDSLAAMIEDCGARHVFLDAAAAAVLDAAAASAGTVTRVALDGSPCGLPLADWIEPTGREPAPIALDPDRAVNIIYSSGTTGKPKGIVQPNRMRWAHVRRGHAFGYGPSATNLVATPLYSNTTLVSFLPALALGSTVVLMPRFEARGFLALAEKHRATHATLVPVQLERVLRVPDFDRFDLSSFRFKFCTSAHLPASTKAEILARWPGGLVEVYGMTEGGGTCMLFAHERGDKLHTVGAPTPGHEFHVIDDDGRVLPQGQVGEVVGRSPSGMMTGYRNAPAETAAAEWHDTRGQRFIRTGDLGHFDADGFLTLVGRKKDVIISGGFNVYAIDLETVLLSHPAVAEAAVVGVPSREWGETPVAFVVLAGAARASADELRAWANARLGKTQRIAAVQTIAELPRSSIGKVLKRDLRERLQQGTVRNANNGSALT